MINEEGSVMDTKENDNLNKGCGDLVSNDNVVTTRHSQEGLPREICMKNFVIL